MEDRYFMLLFILSCVVPIRSAIIKEEHLVHSKLYNFTLDSSVEYILHFPTAQTRNPFRISTLCSTANPKFPILITVKQEQQVMSWQIPMSFRRRENKTFITNTAKTLCYDEDELLTDRNHTFTVYLWTASKTSHNVSLRTEEFLDYYVEANRNYTITTTPSEPNFYYFYKNPNENRTSTFIKIDSYDDTCLIVSLQESMCPVMDSNDDILYRGRYQMITRRGGLYIKDDEFPKGFFLVFLAKIDNSECMKNHLPFEEPREENFFNQTTNITFNLHETIQLHEYLYPTLLLFGLYCIFCIIIALAAKLTYIYGKSNSQNISDETDKDIREDIKQKFYLIEDLKLMHLVKDENDTHKKSYNYTWHILNIGLFYGIPAVQLMTTYQKQVLSSGNEDICYQNFYCSRPLKNIIDFNHIYSNIGYLMTGVTFVAITYFRSTHIKQNKYKGIPKHYGMYYAMGFGLILEGIMSAAYHLCPSQTNFQFDTSFMYTMVVLCMVKLYQNRHPDINASAYSSFTLLGLFVFVAMLGILLESKMLVISFIVAYLVLCLYISFKIYFFGEVLEGISSYYRRYRGQTENEASLPFRKARFIILLITNLINLSSAIVGGIMYPTTLDFATYLLGIFMGNLVLHTTFYIVMKLLNKEKICWEAKIYLVFAILTWGSSSLFFFTPASNWQLSPAESKNFNNDCIFLNFYDQHDVWHMISAPALMFSFLMYMCLDDDIINTPHNQIKVF